MRAHTKNGLTWSDVQDRDFTGRANAHLTPLSRNPAVRARLAVLSALAKAADNREAAKAPSLHTIMEGPNGEALPPRTAFVLYARRSLTDARAKRITVIC